MGLVMQFFQTPGIWSISSNTDCIVIIYDGHCIIICFTFYSYPKSHAGHILQLWVEPLKDALRLLASQTMFAIISHAAV